MSQHYDNSATINVQLISIHAPREGRDLHGLRLLLGRDISIHAPRAGRDILIEVDGKTVVELDKLNEVYKVNGVDVLAKIKEMC